MVKLRYDNHRSTPARTRAAVCRGLMSFVAAA
jgi:hypothetical protein